MKSLTRNNGFTLLELMITIAIVAILIAIATPSFTRMMISHSVSSDQDTLFSLILTARSEAINRGRRVSLCKSTDLVACDSSADWTDGFIVFYDANGDGVINGVDKILKINEKLDKDISLAFNGGDFLTFNSLGRPESNIGTFTFSHSSGNTDYQRIITLTKTGRARKES
jgi:type IV fimbrial biogenesis protein FimT